MVVGASLLAGLLTYLVLRQPDLLRREVEEKTRALTEIAFYDPLTGLTNRRLFQDLLKQHINSAKRYGNTLALLYLDLDDFKRINDTMGHEAGDELLKVVAERLKQTLRASDIVARIGGDEFSVLLQQLSSSAHAGKVCGKIIESLSEPVQLQGSKVIVTASIGIALIPDDGTDVSEVMKNADLAMYSAKESGRNNYQYFSRAMNEVMSTRVELETEMMDALSAEQFVVYYQPIRSLSEDKCIGVEGLVRWQHPTKGLLPPNEFIGLAEETGLIVALGEQVMMLACRQISAMQTPERPLGLSLNISPRQFSDPNLVSHIKQVLIETSFPAKLLELEITESLLINSQDNANAKLAELRALGITVAIDDFGTGYSSLSKLKDLPVDTLKIDRAFVQHLPVSKNDGEIVEIIIALADKLNLNVVAGRCGNRCAVGFPVGVALRFNTGVFV